MDGERERETPWCERSIGNFNSLQGTRKNQTNMVEGLAIHIPG